MIIDADIHISHTSGSGIRISAEQSFGSYTLLEILYVKVAQYNALLDKLPKKDKYKVTAENMARLPKLGI
jgi:hypothetical protein